MAFYAYLNFDGTCRAAFTRYHEVFGGDLTVLAMGDMPPGPDGQTAPAEFADRVAHAALTLDDGGLLMASDIPPGMEFGPAQGIYVSATVPDAAEAKRVFDALADGGSVEMPLGETFFSPAFGMCRDRFGIPWMVNAAMPEG